MLEDILREGFHQLSIPCPDETLQKFRLYYTLLEERNRQMNLTAISGERDVAVLHFLDCAAVLPFLPGGALTVLDLGSGAGFPGLVLKLLRPELCLTLVDSTRKRVDFLHEAAELLELQDLSCLHLRAEDAPAHMRGAYDVVVSRAVARLNILAELGLPFLREGGLFCAMKGPGAEEEVRESVNAFQVLNAAKPQLIVYSVPGLDAGRTLVSAVQLKAVPKTYPRPFAQIRKRPL